MTLQGQGTHRYRISNLNADRETPHGSTPVPSEAGIARRANVCNCTKRGTRWREPPSMRNINREKTAVSLTFSFTAPRKPKVSNKTAHRHFSHSHVFQTLSALRNSGGPHGAKAAFDQRDREGRSALGRWRRCAPRAVAAPAQVGIGRRWSLSAQVHTGMVWNSTGCASGGRNTPGVVGRQHPTCSILEAMNPTR